MNYVYQGMYHSYIDVIGDKMGGDTSVVYFTDPTKFEHHLNKLHNIINIPFKVFHDQFQSLCQTNLVSILKIIICCTHNRVHIVPVGQLKIFCWWLSTVLFIYWIKAKQFVLHFWTCVKLSIL